MVVGALRWCDRVAAFAKGAAINTQQQPSILFVVSDHARKRMDLRGVRRDELAYILAHGSQYHRAGGIWFVLRGRDIPLADRRNGAVTKLQSVVVLMDRDVVITVYHCNDPIRHILTKQRYDASAQRSTLDPRGSLMAS